VVLIFPSESKTKIICANILKCTETDYENEYLNFNTFLVHQCMRQYVREVVMRVLMFYNSRNIKV